MIDLPFKLSAKVRAAQWPKDWSFHSGLTC